MGGGGSGGGRTRLETSLSLTVEDSVSTCPSVLTVLLGRPTHQLRFKPVTFEVDQGHLKDKHLKVFLSPAAVPTSSVVGYVSWALTCLTPQLT